MDGGTIAAAASTIHYALSAKGVEYGIVGGSAVSLLCAHYGLGQRSTNDIDLIIIPDREKNLDASSISKALYEEFPQYFTKIDQYGVQIPAVLIGGELGHAEVEIFDIDAWPHRRQYDLRDPDNDRVTLQINQYPISVLSPRWIVREKILSQHQRQGAQKEKSDILDIKMLLPLLDDGTLKFDTNERIDALNALLAKEPDLRGQLQEKIVCPAVFDAKVANPEI
ncbi:hypothetical protein BFW01_g390 [Lasiodiplodia theobromae]|uniref:Uncharacterized protein n=1 Tax=Lasiodiplodia theobromae TaxID=45133 RepID=A0A8H7IQL1_9PEZI|nr:hypothetical protein BFW01_g390 [Lasiodiplodia theobromae]